MNSKRHTLSLDSRSSLKITAANEVISFDETLISLSVGESVLNISGNGLSIKNLSLENGDIEIDGNITAVVYFDEDRRKKKSRFFGRA
ncbi:MAG: sporulation protein YabP [Ruminococcaceae bacterium]|nr:sporulation protein YabP [Oscillospiraceae bacterium]